jgi:hypothetical protein
MLLRRRSSPRQSTPRSSSIDHLTGDPIYEDEGRDDPNAAGLEGHALTPAEVLEFFNRTEGYGYSRAFAIDALARGDRCFGLFEGFVVLRRRANRVRWFATRG